ncbi:MAG: hypothetical protein ACLQU9_04390 [Acidimicrobiales bacterium]|jgi:hypothetical protein
MGTPLRHVRISAGRRPVRWCSAAVFAGLAALVTSLFALPAPVQAGLLGGGSSEYVVSAPSGTLATALNAVSSVGATVGTTLGFDDAATGTGRSWPV